MSASPAERRTPSSWLAGGLAVIGFACASTSGVTEPPPRPTLEHVVLREVTAELERFQRIEVAEAEGYVHPGENDHIQMGEHWIHPDLLNDAECDIGAPEFLQYLVIRGERRLIGTGYVCDLEDGGRPPDWFGIDVIWHTHGPEICGWEGGGVVDARPFAETMPNELTDESWRDACEGLWGTPEIRPVAMLHTWNWIPHPDGPFVHENRAIPFLRAGLAVPDRAFLDSDAGRAVLETLALAHGAEGVRYLGGLLAVDASTWRWMRTLWVVGRARDRGAELVEGMVAAESRGDRDGYLAAAYAGASELARLHEAMAGVLTSDERVVVERFFAALDIHEHHEPDAQNHAHRHH